MTDGLRTPAPLVSLAGVYVLRAGRPALSGIDWELLPGQYWGIFGGNGAGKSTFLSLVRGDSWPSKGARLYRDAWDGPHASGEPRVSPIGFRERTAMVSAEQQLWYARAEADPDVVQVVVSGFYNAPLAYGPITAGQDKAARAALDLVGLGDKAEARLSRLSQGQQRRVLLARALAMEPRLLLLDECLEGLDKRARQAMLDILARLPGAGTALLAATHRAEEAHALPLDGGLVLEAGRIVFSGGPDEAIALAFPAPRKGRSRQPQPERQAGEKPEKATAATEHEPAPRGGEDFLLAFERVTVLRGGAAALADFSWRVRTGEHWAVVGENGAGKSTLLALAAGDLHPAAGRVGRFGSFAPLSLWAIRRRAALVSFDLHVAHDRPVTALEAVISGLRGHIGLHAPQTPEETARAVAVLGDLGLAELAERPITELSSGQARRVLLARALTGRPRLMLLDEPFAGLDAASRAAMLATLDRLSAHTTLVLATHHDDDLPKAVGNVLRLTPGGQRSA